MPKFFRSALQLEIVILGMQNVPSYEVYGNPRMVRTAYDSTPFQHPRCTLRWVAADSRGRLANWMRMARRFIGKGKLFPDRLTRQLIMYVQDADGRFREEPFGEVPEHECDEHMTRLVDSGQVNGIWDSGLP